MRQRSRAWRILSLAITSFVFASAVGAGRGPRRRPASGHLGNLGARSR